MRIHKESIDRWFDYSIHMESRTIYVGSFKTTEEGEESGVDAAMAEYLMKGLHLFKVQKTNKRVLIIMNNPGGDWYHGMAIYDYIRSCKFKVDVEIYGHAMSMGSVILQAADKRYVSEESKIMIHDGYMGLRAVHPKVFESWGEECKRIRQRMYEIYTKRAGNTPAYWEKQCAFDKFYNAQEATEIGLADKIIISYE